MMEKMTRRAFMKNVGMVAAAMAAAGALSACDGDAPAQPSQPAQTEKPTTNSTGLDLSEIRLSRGVMEKKDGYYFHTMFTLKNTTKSSVTLKKELFTAKLDNGAEQKAVRIYEKNPDRENSMVSFETKELAADASEYIGVSFMMAKEGYDNFWTTNHKVELIVHNNDKTASFTLNTKN